VGLNIGIRKEEREVKEVGNRFIRERRKEMP